MRIGTTLQTLLMALMLAPAAFPASPGTDHPDEHSPFERAMAEFKDDFERLSGGVALSAFLDLSAQDSVEGNLQLGALEIGLERPFSDRAAFAGAVVMNEEGLTVGSASIDIRLNRGIAEPGRARVHLQAGQFDIPFGQDWRNYATKDRIEVSAPLTTERILDGGLNHRAILLRGEGDRGEWAVFGFRDAEGEDAFGGRLAWRLVSTGRVGAEAGVSVVREPGSASLASVHSEAEIGRWQVRTEYLHRRMAGDAERGWQATGAFDAGTIGSTPLKPFARFDSLTAVEGKQTRLTAGVNALAASFLIVKIEYRHLLEGPQGSDHQDGIGAQAVIVF